MKSMARNGTRSSARRLKQALVREGSVAADEDKTNNSANMFLVLVKNTGGLCRYHGTYIAGDICGNCDAAVYTV